MRILLIELRRSPFLWAVAPMTALALMLLLRERAVWEHVWPQASVIAVNSATALPGVAVAVLAAWSSQRVHRGATGDLLSAAARPRWQAEALHLLGTVIFAGIPLVIVSTVAAVIASRSAPAGFLWPSYLIMGVAAVMITSALGHVVGSVVAGKLAAPVAGVLAYVPLSMMSLLVPYYGEASKEADPLALTVRVLLGVACAVAALVVFRRGWWRWTALTGITVLALALILAGPPQRWRPATDHARCAQAEEARVCVWPENEAHLAEVVRASRDVLTAARGVLPAPADIAEEGLATEQPAFHLAVVPAAAHQTFVSLLVSEFTWSTMAICTQEAEANGRARMASLAMLDTWISSVARGGLQDSQWDPSNLSPAGRRQVASVLALPRAEQVAWARRQVSVMRTCG